MKLEISQNIKNLNNKLYKAIFRFITSMVNNETHTGICDSDMFSDPMDGSLPLTSYLALAKANAKEERIVRLPLVGTLVFPRKNPALLRNKYPSVKSTLMTYWFGKHPLSRRENLYLKFQEENEMMVQELEIQKTSDETVFVKETTREKLVERVTHTFRKPLKTTQRPEQGEELINFYDRIFSQLQYQEIRFRAHKNFKGYFVESINIPPHLERKIGEQGWVDL